MLDPRQPLNDATGDLGEQIALLAVHIDAATHRMLQLIAQFDHQQGWAEQGCLSCAHWLSWRLGWTPATARERLRVAHALEALPAIGAAVATGELSYSKARAVTRVATPASDTEWASTALEATAAQLERIVPAATDGRRRAKSWRAPNATKTSAACRHSMTTTACRWCAGG